MSQLRAIRAALERLTIGELIPVFSYNQEKRCFGLAHDDDRGRTTGVDIAAGWYGVPAIGVNNQIIADIEELFMLDYPADTMIQVQRLATVNIDATIRAYLRPKEATLALGANNGLSVEQKKALQTQVQERKKFLKEGKEKPLIKGTDHLLKEEVIFISVRILSKTPPSEKKLAEHKAVFDRVETQLDKIGIRPKRMDPQAYINVISGILGMGETVPVPVYDENLPIREQVAHSEDHIAAETTHCRVNGRYVSSVSAHRYPSKHHLSRMLPLFGDIMGSTRQINEPYMASLNVIIPDFVKTRQHYTGNRLWLRNFSDKGDIRKYSPAMVGRAKEFEKMDAAIGTDGVICKLWMNFLTFSDSADKAEAAIQNFKTMSRGYGWDFRSDKRMHGINLLQCLPMCADPRLEPDLKRYQMKAAKHASHLVPIIGEWAGNSHLPIQLYVSRRGSLTTINTWDSSEGHNIIVSASTGSGKSVWMSDFALQNLAHGVKVSLIDKGRSFKRMVNILGGQYFDFIEPGEYNLNPFLQVKDIDEESEQMSMIFQTMADPSGGLDNVQKPRLTTIIREGWAEHGRRCSVDWVAERCKEDEDRRVRDLAEMLAPYCSHGQYGSWFATGVPLSFNENLLTGIELSGLDNKASLQAVVLQMVLMELQRLMYLEDLQGTGQKSMIAIDEAAELLVQNGPAVFCEKMARQARKYNSAVAIITQLLSDFQYKIPTGRGILGNTAFKILLSQKQEVIQELRKENWAGLSDYEVAMLEYVQTARGRYSEALIVTPNGSGVGRLVLPRYDQLLYTTDPEEKAAIKRLQDQGMSIDKAIRRLAGSDDDEAEQITAEGGLQQRRQVA